MNDSDFIGGGSHDSVNVEPKPMLKLPDELHTLADDRSRLKHPSNFHPAVGNGVHPTARSGSPSGDKSVLNEVEIDAAIGKGQDQDENKDETLHVIAETLLDNAKWCWANPSFPYLDEPPKPIAFLRDFVLKNTPCVMKNLKVCGWKTPWDWQDLAVLSGGGTRKVRVNATPNGRGDAVIQLGNGERVFVKPMERMMPIDEFLLWLKQEEHESNDVFYLSAQNDSLREEFRALIDKGFAPSSLPYGDDVFGKQADAVNLWIGNELAVSTMHRDVSYENMYCVLKGCKVFHLMPPCCAPFLNEIERSNASYERDSEGNWKITKDTDDSPKTSWIAIDVADGVRWPKDEYALFEAFPQMRDLVQRVEVHAGETLYLPAGWFHRVTQTEPTCAVNYWYDRDFNAIWALTETIEALAKLKTQKS